MPNDLIFEFCIDSVASAVAVEKGGGHRVELCDNLLEGGTTPSAGAIALARKLVDIEINVMIRPRGSDFHYSDVEFEIMKFDIEQAKKLGANGVVIGLLSPDGSIDVRRTRELVELARPLSVTFHRAFDMCRDPYEALEQLIELGIDRILTSGQEPSVVEGLELITDLVQKAGDRIIIMPGAGITERNLAKVVAQSKAKEFHVVGTVPVQSQMVYRNSHLFMGGELRPPEYSFMVTDAGRVGGFLNSAG